MKNKISNQELKGTSDWLPEEFALRKYIFDTWRKVCLRYGFEEYLTPLFEPAEVYRAKSGEDVGGKELLTFEDLGGRELAVRPEMTPSVVRMTSKFYRSAPKPIKLFSIANFFRNEKPQRGRNREFWQLNCDVFGSNNIKADIEIMKLALDIVLEFDPPQNSFSLNINSRRLLEAFFVYLKIETDKKNDFFRILDKKNKLSAEDFANKLKEIGLNDEAIHKINSFLNGAASSDWLEIMMSTEELKAAYNEIKEVVTALSDLGYGDWLEFNPSVIRGFDYYDGLVFEVFDKHKDNNRAMFGGGRYNGLGGIFGESDFPAVGFAPGDETMKLFLESWGIADKAKKEKAETYYLPLLEGVSSFEVDRLAKVLRSRGLNILSGLEEQKINKALEFANKKGLAKVIIFGGDESKKGAYKIKDMLSGEEKEVVL